MAGAQKMAEKVPGWVERVRLTLESRVRMIVREEVGHLEKTMNAKFDAVYIRIDSLENRIPMIQDIADLKARLAAVESRRGG
jgi:hypothetical protein